MNQMIENMLSHYNIGDIYDQKNAMKEIMQEIVLCGLSRAGFFDKAAFYGGTALRVFYGLDRFSEDLDFSLEVPDERFSLAMYLPTLTNEINAFGLQVNIEEKVKTVDSHIQSAFLKGNTREHFLLFYPDSTAALEVPKDEKIKIKFEIDVEPPAFAGFEKKYRLLPVPYEVKLYDLPSLFAGKIHAVLCRDWKHRVKGRDLYDYIFYLSKRVPFNGRHLRERLIESGFLSRTETFSLERIKMMLNERFDRIAYQTAQLDVIPFIKDKSVLQSWSADFFKQITDGLQEA